jgi:hypothetical protein
MSERSRDEHLAWAKARALRYLDRAELSEAYTSMGSDLQKHPDLKCSETMMQLGLLYLMSHNASALRRWIEGFR